MDVVLDVTRVRFCFAEGAEPGAVPPVLLQLVRAAPPQTGPGAHRPQPVCGAPEEGKKTGSWFWVQAPPPHRARPAGFTFILKVCLLGPAELCQISAPSNVLSAARWSSGSLVSHSLKVHRSHVLLSVLSPVSCSIDSAPFSQLTPLSPAAVHRSVQEQRRPDHRSDPETKLQLLHGADGRPRHVRLHDVRR